MRKRLTKYWKPSARPVFRNYNNIVGVGKAFLSSRGHNYFSKTLVQLRFCFRIIRQGLCPPRRCRISAPNPELFQGQNPRYAFCPALRVVLEEILSSASIRVPGSAPSTETGVSGVDDRCQYSDFPSVMDYIVESCEKAGSGACRRSELRFTLLQRIMDCKGRLPK
jgi:hypothetical protein